MRLLDADALTEFIENKYDITWERDYEGGINAVKDWRKGGKKDDRKHR